MTRLRHYSVFGGPDGRSIVSVARHVTHIVAENGPDDRMRQFEYVLVDAPDRTKVFVPKEDADLLEAFREACEVAGQRERAVFVAEVARRGISDAVTSRQAASMIGGCYRY